MALEGTRDRFRTAAWLYGAAGLVYVLDRVTKLVVEAELAGRPPIELIPGVLHLTFTENPGGAFSLFGGAPWLFFGASVVVAAIIVVASFRIGGALLPAAMGLVLGGALGNLTDRIVRGPGVSGKVVDFIDFQVWPVFNVADSAIVVGALLIVLAGARRGEGERRGGTTPDGSPPARAAGDG